MLIIIPNNNIITRFSFLCQEFFILNTNMTKIIIVFIGEYQLTNLVKIASIIFQLKYIFNHINAYKTNLIS